MKCFYLLEEMRDKIIKQTRIDLSPQALSIPDCAKELRPPRAVAENPYLCLNPAPSGGPPSDSPGRLQPPRGGGPSGGPPLGLVEFSVLRQMLQFSFDGKDTKERSVVGVHRQILSLVGCFKSRGPRASVYRAPQNCKGEGNGERCQGKKLRDRAIERESRERQRHGHRETETERGIDRERRASF